MFSRKKNSQTGKSLAVCFFSRYRITHHWRLVPVMLDFGGS